jgi:hypothetical protein
MRVPQYLELFERKIDNWVGMYFVLVSKRRFSRIEFWDFDYAIRALLMCNGQGALRRKLYEHCGIEL